MDLTPFAALPRRIADARNPSSGRFADLSRRMHERGAFARPDRNPFLGAMLEAHAHDRDLSPEVRRDIERWLEDRDEHVDEDRAVDEEAIEAARYDRDEASYRAWLDAQRGPRADRSTIASE
jgi:hypothetical protein